MAEQVWREHGLRQAALAGEAEAWRTLVHDHAEPLRRYLAWRLGGRLDALDDLTQEVWLQAARSLRLFQPKRGLFMHWLLGISFQVLRNHRRYMVRRQYQPLAVEPAVAEANAATDGERITQALASLSPDHEAVLRQKYLEGCSVTEIAQQRGAREKAVESLLTRARQAFEQAYQRGDHDERH